MRFCELFLGVIGVLLFVGSASAQNAPRVRLRQITDAENESLNILTMPAPKNTVQWAVAIITKEVPINFPGLPRDQAFEQTTLIFDPGTGENLPTEATLVLLPPRPTDANGAYIQPTRMAGQRFRTAYGNSIWLFNIDAHLEQIRSGALQFRIEAQPRAKPEYELKPAIFRDFTAWSYFDSRISDEEWIGVVQRSDQTYALAVRGGQAAAAPAPAQTGTSTTTPQAPQTSKTPPAAPSSTEPSTRSTAPKTNEHPGCRVCEMMGVKH